MMEEGKKRLVLILILAVLVAGSSFYFYQQKSKVSETAVFVPAANNALVTDKADNSEIVVYISGAVNKPGILSVTSGSRVVDVVNAAGGFAPGADPAKVNLAKVVKDGMQVNVPGGVISPTGTGTGAGKQVASNVTSNAGGYNSEKVSINYAGKTELDKLPGIGPAMADKIIEYRQMNGAFRDVSELKKVPGISEAKFNGLKDKITL